MHWERNVFINKYTRNNVEETSNYVLYSFEMNYLSPFSEITDRQLQNLTMNT